jgi:hypothetical protein
MRSAMILLSFVATACQVTEPAPETTPSTGPAAAPPVERLPSAYGALRVLLGVVERTGSVVLRRIECETVRAPGAAKSQVRASLDLTISGGDSVEATRTFDRFEHELRANAWCLDFQVRSTRVLPEDRGIRSDGVVVLVDASAIPAGSGGRAVAASPEKKTVLVHARRAAAQASVGQIDCSMRTVNPERGVEETVYRFSPTAKEASFRLDDLRAFLGELDALAGGEITSIDLEPAKKPVGTEPVETWVFQVELTARAG